RRSRTKTTSSAWRPTSSCPRKSSPRRPRGEPRRRGARPGRAQHPMIVLGIDPGTAATGYGVVERNGSHLRMLEFGVLETLAGGTAGERLVAIHAGVAELIARHQPGIVGVERIFFSRNVQTAFSVGQARGVAILAAAQSGLPIFEYTPNEVKIAVTGYGRASKEQVQRMVQTLLG